MNKKVEKIIIQTIDEEKPKTIHQLVETLEPKLSMEKDEIMEIVLQLKRDGKVEYLNEMTLEEKQSFSSFLNTRAARWYWITLLLIALTVVAVFTINEQSTFAFIRSSLGFVFVVIIPGYSLIRAILPKRFSKSGKTQIDQLTGFLLGIVLSIGIVSMVGLVLDYSDWGVNLNSLVFSLSILTGAFATIAIAQEYQRANDFASYS